MKEQTRIAVGDKVKITDRSWIFGIDTKKGKRIDAPWPLDENVWLEVLETGIKAVEPCYSGKQSPSHAECDLLVTDGDSCFYFVPSHIIEKVQSLKHTITIDDKRIEISHESFMALKSQLMD